MPHTFAVSKVEPAVVKRRDPLVLNKLYTHGKTIGGEVVQSSNMSGVVTSPYSNGFVGTALSCYNNHHKMVLRPDDVWIAILVQFSKYVDANGEELRSLFVNFQGKKELEAFQMATLMTADYPKLIQDLVDQITKNIVDENMTKWLLPSFSTTTATDVAVAGAVMMSAMQKYFDYKMSLCCGIPEVTLLGEVEDWVEIRNRIDKIKLYDMDKGQMTKWHTLLVPILDNFVESIKGNPNVEWWNRICSHHGGGSGPSYISGWISVFTIFSDESKWMGDKFDQPVNYSYTRTEKSDWPVIDTNNISPGYVSVPVKIADNGKEYASMLVAGHIGQTIGKDEMTIQPITSWYIALKDEAVLAKNNVDPFSRKKN